MENIRKALDSAVSKISDQHYEQSFAYFLFWFKIGQTYSQISPDLIFDSIYERRGSSPYSPQSDFIYPAAPLILRFANDIESDPTLAPYSPGLRTRFCAKVLQGFFDRDLRIVYCGSIYGNFCTDINFVAHCANLGYLEEDTIRDHILQSLISHGTLYDHQAIALAILFKIAGATFAAYVDPIVVDRCFELLKNHGNTNRRGWSELLQGVIKLRERDWEGLPPPPEFTTGKPKPTGKDRKDPTATPIATSLGLPKGDTEPQVPQHPSPEPVTCETDTVPASPVTQSPSISISTLSDFTIADPSDDESPIDPAATIPHGTFYLEDGNVEVLCGNALFRVHTSILSFHSPALRRMFAQTSLASAESPNGCPRILSSDTATDFTTLLKMIYLPGFPERNKVPDFTTFSSLLRITSKYELPTVRSHLLEVVRDAYPETFEGLSPSKPLGEGIFSGPIPHPNEVLNLFVQQKLKSALPMAYYMAARRGLGSLMDRRLPQSATLSPEILQSAIGGLMALREIELNETHRLIFEPEVSIPCSRPKCPSRTPTSQAALDAYRKVFNYIVGPSQKGTKVLQVLDFCLFVAFSPDPPDICGICEMRWESGHADLRKKAWAMLPDIFGLTS